MTPLYLNPPSSHVAQQQAEDHHDHQDHQGLKLFNIPSPYHHHHHHQPSSSSSSLVSFPTFFDSATTTHVHPQSHLCHHKGDKAMWHGGASSSNYDQTCSSSSSLAQPHVVEDISTSNNRPRAVKWMSSKMRLMQKMTNRHPPPASDEMTDHPENSETSFSSNNNNNDNSTAGAVIRVCSDCNTNTTPLWRSGPRGPKSLCNACGIRQRKARRAMAEAAAAEEGGGFVVGTTDTSPWKGKEKKSRGSHGSNFLRCNKNKNSKLIITNNIKRNDNNNNNNNNKICFRGLGFERVFPQDVAEAAMLLMELSCGLINHSS